MGICSSSRSHALRSKTTAAVGETEIPAPDSPRRASSETDPSLSLSLATTTATSATTAPHGQSSGALLLDPSPSKPEPSLRTLNQAYTDQCFRISATLPPDGHTLRYEAEPVECQELRKLALPGQVLLRATRMAEAGGEEGEAGSGKQLERLAARRLALLQYLRHPNILTLYDAWKSSDLVLWELTDTHPGVTLQAFVEQGSPLDEAQARGMAQQLLQAVDYLHANGVAVRTLTYSSVVAVAATQGSSSSSCALKIVDLSFCKSFSLGKLSTACGSPYFVAPEVLKADSYGPSVDIWSLGVILYFILAGSLPFVGDSVPALFKKITRAQFDFASQPWPSRSAACRDLISRMIVLDADLRWNASMCLTHQWFVG